MDELVIRRACAQDAPRLTAIAHAAKRHWGYPDSLLALWARDLNVSPNAIEDDLIFCAALASDIVGFYAVSQEGNWFELEHMWVHPDYMKRGYGARLFAHALATVRAHGGQALRIASDPNAEGFYLRMGARRIGEEPSTPAGRMLPLLLFDLEEST
jgi:GNAT superfamily N-acetyltransferase